MHVLELKDRLKLTAEQEAKMQHLMHAMFAESKPKSARLLEAEARLRRLFAEHAADDAAVRAAVDAVEARAARGTAGPSPHAPQDARSPDEEQRRILSRGALGRSLAGSGSDHTRTPTTSRPAAAPRTHTARQSAVVARTLTHAWPTRRPPSAGSSRS